MSDERAPYETRALALEAALVKEEDRQKSAGTYELCEKMFVDGWCLVYYLREAHTIELHPTRFDILDHFGVGSPFLKRAMQRALQLGDTPMTKPALRPALRPTRR